MHDLTRFNAHTLFQQIPEILGRMSKGGNMGVAAQKELDHLLRMLKQRIISGESTGNRISDMLIVSQSLTDTVWHTPLMLSKIADMLKPMLWVFYSGVRHAPPDSIDCSINEIVTLLSGKLIILTGPTEQHWGCALKTERGVRFEVKQLSWTNPHMDILGHREWECPDLLRMIGGETSTSQLEHMFCRKRESAHSLTSTKLEPTWPVERTLRPLVDIALDAALKLLNNPGDVTTT